MAAQKWYVWGGFDYHGNLLVFFGFWCVACQFLYVGTLGQDWNVPLLARLLKGIALTIALGIRDLIPHSFLVPCTCVGHWDRYGPKPFFWVL